MQRGQVQFVTAGFVTTGLVAIGFIAMNSNIARAGIASALVPSLVLTASLVEFAAFVLLAVIFAKTRWRALLPLTTTLQFCAMVDTMLFLLLPFARTNDMPMLPYRGASPWLHVAWFAVFAVGAAWYGVERARPVALSRAMADRIVAVWMPVTMIASAAAVVLVTRAGPHLPPLAAGMDLTPYRTSGVGYACFAVLIAALLVLTRNLLAAETIGIDNAVLAATYAVAASALVNLIVDSRLHPLWFLGRLFTIAAPAIIVIAAIRHLVARLNDSVRFENAALRVEATAFEQNAAVEAAIVKSQFVATVSHELRTPLGGIIGMAELLQRTSLNEQQAFCTNAIRSSADTLLRIVNDLLDFSRVEAGRLEIENVPFDVAQTIDDVATLFREAAERRGVGLHVFIDPAVPATVSGDQTRLKQVLQNLLNNAVRFTHEGSIRVEVGVDEGTERPMLRFGVHDTGIGISKNAQERIFQPFTQEDASTARRFGGTGLGLAIARHLVQLMGGEITVRSILGVGSTFAFTIPLRSIALHGPVDRPLRNLSILIVESDPTVCTLLQRYADAWEMRSHTAGSLAEARAQIERVICETGCDIVVVGPDIDPADATAFARERRSTAVLSGASWIFVGHDLSETAPPGFDAHVPGPLRQSTLFDAIVRLRRHGFLERSAPAAGGIAERAARSERILIAEDNEINAALLVAQLEHLGFASDVVSDGEAAIEAALTRDYDLIFMDCQMPRIDGFEAARRIRSRSSGRYVPIVAVTANVLPGYRDICLAAGMNAYIAKPALIGPLASVIDRWLPALPETHVDAPPPDAAVTTSVGRDVRGRLREIFHGDEARVEATLALAVASLRESAGLLPAHLDTSDAAGAARVAHKLKGVALEIGLSGVADQARLIEQAVRNDDWDAAAATYAQLTQCIDRVAAQAASGSAT